jgi:predicted metal-dependent hydrolase
MTNSHLINIDGIGTVIMEYSTRAKRVVIYVRPFKGIRVAVPARVSLKRALEFVQLKKTWIQKNLTRVKRYENEAKEAKVFYSLIDKTAAMEKLTVRLNYLAQKHGFTYNRITIRNQKMRWGSCSHKNNISLNMKLVLLPEELIDYVIIHELVHSRIHDHSKKFWTEVSRYVGSGKTLAKRLKVEEGWLLRGSKN